MKVDKVWLVRRFVVAPAVVTLAAVVWVTTPVWIMVALVLSPFLPGRWRPLRVAWVALLYLSAQAVLLVVMFGLWISSGFGRRLRDPYYLGIHYELAEGVLVVLFRAARWVLRLKIVTEGDSPARLVDKPLLVCCRHAGPGDSFTLIYALLHWYRREPRVVLKETLAWDPAIGVLLSRLPSRFISPRTSPPPTATPGPAGLGPLSEQQPYAGQGLTAQIAALAAGLDADDAFVIFPEGGNFTEERRDKAIARLRSLGMERLAQRAESMTYVLAPRPGGFLAALDAAPEADVVLVGHTGLDHLNTIGDVWRALPMDKRIIMRWWQVPRAEIPKDREARIDWLFAWWERIDTWVAENRPEDLPPTGSRV